MTLAASTNMLIMSLLIFQQGQLRFQRQFKIRVLADAALWYVLFLVISTQTNVLHFCEGDKSICSQEEKKKKVGRPIAYKGDPNAMSLTDTERRRIKRRIANRESARRVRARRQGILEELEVEVSYASIQQSTTLSCAFNAYLAAPACLALVSCRILFGQPACFVVCRWSKSVNPTLTSRSTSLMSQGTLIC